MKLHKQDIDIAIDDDTLNFILDGSSIIDNTDTSIYSDNIVSDCTHELFHIPIEVPFVELSEYKYRDFVDSASSVQCKLNSIIKGGTRDKIKLVKIFDNYVKIYNKIAIEGLHLFDLYILHLTTYNQLDTVIDTNTIARCMRLLVDGVTFRKTKNLISNTEIDLIKQVKDSKFNFKAPDDHTFKTIGDSFLKPLDSFATTAITNTILLVQMNFKKYQSRYITYKLRSFVPDTIVSNTEIKFIVNRVQKLINDEEIYESKHEQKIKNIMNKLNIDKKLNDFIKSEKDTLSNIFHQKLKFSNYGKQVDNVANKNLIRYLKYFSIMLTFIESVNGQRFSLVPHSQPQMNFIHFDSKSLYNVYCEWKNHTKNKLTPEKFDEQFDFYLHKIFDIRNKYRNLYRKFPSIRSIATNGLVISITFEKLRTVKYIADKNIRDEKNKERKEKNEEIKQEIKEENNRIRNEQKMNVDGMSAEIKSIDNMLKNCISELNKLNKKKKFTENDIDDKYQLEFMIEDLTEQKSYLESVRENYTNKKEIKEIKEIQKIPLTLNMKNGIYYAEELTCTNEILNEYDVVGFDPGNSTMVDFSSESCVHSKINKMEYLDLAHILANTKWMQKMMCECKYKIKDSDGKVIEVSIEQINREISLNTYKTADMDKYMRYVEAIRKYWNIIWLFNSQKSILNKKFDGYTFKQKAIAEIVRRIIKKLKDKKNIDEYRKDEFDENKFNKPKLIAFGLGNGSMTISNTKGSTAKGAIKMLILELAKQFPVILVQEDYTSQLCCDCGEQLEAVQTYQYQSVDKIIKKSEEVYEREYKKLENNKGLSKQEKINSALIEQEIYVQKNIKAIDETIRKRQEIHKLKKENKRKNGKEIEEKEKEVSNLGCYKNCYSLRRCVKKHDIVVVTDKDEGNKNKKIKRIEKRCKTIERNKNASINMIKVTKIIITEGHRGKFIKKK